jgi:hypothetical protein
VLETTIVGWGADLDPANRPAVPMENFNPGGTGAHWDFPERQIPRYKREKSTEHKFLTPVFGTVCPPRGLSGLIRRYAYTLSEARAAHWTLLVLADRVDVIESRISSALRLRPDNPIAEMGLRSELKRHGLRSRMGQHRSDLIHVPVDVLIFAGSTVATVAAVVAIGSAVRSGLGYGARRRSRRANRGLLATIGRLFAPMGLRA